MAKVRVSLDRLKEGVGYRPDFSRGTFYLDRASGEVEYLNDRDAEQERGRGRDLLGIAPVAEREELGWMAEFAEKRRAQGQVGEWRQLVSALNGSDSVRRFNAALALFPEARSAWSGERERRLLLAAAEWLSGLGDGFEAG
jgi:hypothetical protein